MRRDTPIVNLKISKHSFCGAAGNDAKSTIQRMTRNQDFDKADGTYDNINANGSQFYANEERRLASDCMNMTGDYPCNAGGDYQANGRFKEWFKKNKLNLGLMILAPTPGAMTAAQIKWLKDLRKKRKENKITQAAYEKGLAEAGYPGGEANLPPHLKEAEIDKTIAAAEVNIAANPAAENPKSNTNKILLIGGISLGAILLVTGIVIAVKRSKKHK